MQKSRNKIQLSLYYLALSLGGFVMIYPFIFTLFGSMLTLEEYLNVKSIFFLPKRFNASVFNNIMFFFQVNGVWHSLGMTFARFVFFSISNIILSVFVGFIFAKIDFKGKKIVFYYFMLSMMIPAVAFMLPSYILMARFPLVGGNNILGQGGSGFIGSPAALFIGGWFSGYNIFLVRQSIYDIGDEIGEAAEIDGANLFTIVIKIYMPLVMPVIAVILIGLFIGMWNDYLTPMIYLMGNNNGKIRPIGYFVFNMMEAAKGPQGSVPNYPKIFGVQFMVMLVPILVFLFLQKYFITGISMGAVKG